MLWVAVKVSSDPVIYMHRYHGRIYGVLFETES